MRLEQLTPPSPLLQPEHHALAARARAAFAPFEPQGVYDERTLVADLAATGF